jgi:hypothetical protein
MSKAKERDGVFQRQDRRGLFVSYIDTSGKRRKERVVAHTRRQALEVNASLLRSPRLPRVVQAP